MKRLLIFEHHLLGDSVMSLPLLRAALREYEVHVAASPAAAQLYRLVLPAGHVHPFNPPVRGKRGPARWPGFLRELRELHRLRADVAVTVWADLRVHLLAWLLGIPRRVGFPMNETNYYAHHIPWRRRQLRAAMRLQNVLEAAGIHPLTHPLQRRDYRQHHVIDWTQLGEGLGLLVPLEFPWLEQKNFPLPEAARAFFERQNGRPVWLLHPGAGKDLRRWPHFPAVVRDFFGAHEIPLVILEDPAVARIELPHANCLAWPMTTLADFTALVDACRYVLCNDSAAAHFGAAMGRHVVAIFGPGSAEWFAPFAPSRTVIESSICPYRPCFDRCLQPSVICLADISLPRVMDELEKLRVSDVPST